MSSAATGPENTRKPRQKKSAAQRAAEAKQADADRAATPLGARLRARLGESGARSLLALVRGAWWPVPLWPAMSWRCSRR